MTIRRATRDDRETVRELWQEFCCESPPEDWLPFDLEEQLREIDEILRDGLAVLAEEDGSAVGLALARRKGPRLGELTDLFVRPAARRSGVGKALMREVAAWFADGEIDHVSLDVAATNTAARTLYERAGFREWKLDLVARTEQLLARLEPVEGETFGSIHVQTDDPSVVERAVAKFVPRLGRSAGTTITGPRNGWTAVYDELCDREPKLLQRLAREVSQATGAIVLTLGIERGAVVHYALYDRGGVVDEYLSVPEFYGPLPPGDVVALGANPTVVARLTGADPAAVRSVARTASSPADLPPAPELLADLAEMLGVEGAEHGYQPAA